MFKYFISTGCSFTEVPFVELNGMSKPNMSLYPHPKTSLSWPVHVNNHLIDCTPKYSGKGGSGNGIISRTTIYEVTEALKQYKPEDILVGIMWSGSYRKEVYYSEPKFQHHNIDNGSLHQSNPASIGGNYNFYKVMPYWEDELSTWYYKHIYDEVGSNIESLEHILRTQWFLKSHNIRYFMTTYYPEVFPKGDMVNHVDIKHLYDMVDFNEFIDVDSEYEWCVRKQDPAVEAWDPYGASIPHPNTKLHKAFADEVIMPHLEKKGWL